MIEEVNDAYAFIKIKCPTVPKETLEFMKESAIKAAKEIGWGSCLYGDEDYYM